jgi:ABC-type uncharacterized transport system fused permease/ATPase subunit
VYPTPIEGEGEGAGEGAGEGGPDEARAWEALGTLGLQHLCAHAAPPSFPPCLPPSSPRGPPPSSLRAVTGDWPNRLSRGEAQRLCLARALYHQPRLLFLDEATSAVEESMERRVYELLRRGWGEGRGREGGRRVTVVSTGHRASLVGLHDRVIDLEGPHR